MFICWPLLDPQWGNMMDRTATNEKEHKFCRRSLLAITVRSTHRVGSIHLRHMLLQKCRRQKKK